MAGQVSARPQDRRPRGDALQTASTLGSLGRAKRRQAALAWRRSGSTGRMLGDQFSMAHPGPVLRVARHLHRGGRRWNRARGCATRGPRKWKLHKDLMQRGVGRAWPAGAAGDGAGGAADIGALFADRKKWKFRQRPYGTWYGVRAATSWRVWPALWGGGLRRWRPREQSGRC